MSDAEWLKWRRGGITATDVADAANGTYGGAHGVVARKLGLIETEENDAMRRGLRWEQPIADAASALLGLHVVGEQAWCQHVDDERWRATIDGLLSPLPEASIEDCVGVLEIKTRGLGVKPARERWFDQVQWQMLVTNMPSAVIAEVEIDDADDTAIGLTFHRLNADTARQWTLTQIAEELWQHVTNGELPDPVASSLEDVKRLNRPNGDTEPADLEDIGDKVARFNAVKSALKVAKDEVAEIEALIRHRLGTAQSGTASGWRVWLNDPPKKIPPQRHDALAKQYPECAPGGRLSVTELKKQHPDVWEANRIPLGNGTLVVKEKP